jgi:type IV pilus assembly protein PilE
MEGRMRNHKKSDAGVSLIELMVTVAMVAILASIAVPSYQAYVMRGKRSAAESALMDLAVKQQAYLVDARAYATSLDSLHFTAPAEIRNDFLFFISDVDNAATPPTFSISARPLGIMQNDTSCGMAPDNPLKITQDGTKTPSACWQK